MKAVVALLVCGALSACSTLPIKDGDGSPVPASRVFVSSAAGPATVPDEGTFVFLRDTGFFGGGCNHAVYLDAVKVFEIGVSERIEIHAPAGHHLLRIEDATLICPATTTSLETDLKPGARQVYRIQLSRNQQVNFSRQE